MADNFLQLLYNELASGQDNTLRAPALPAISVPTADVSSLLVAVKQLKSAIDLVLGRSGSVLDKALTPRDLLDAGALKITVGPHIVGSTDGVDDGTIDVGSGGGGGVGFEDPRPVLDAPPVPTNLTAQGAFKNIILTWDLLDYQNHAYVEIFRALSNNLGAAVKIGQTTSNQFVDGTGVMNTTYWYWVRAVAYAPSDGTLLIGAFNDVSGTSAGILQIGTTDLGPLIVEAGNLADGSVTASKLASAAIDKTKIAAGLQFIEIVSTLPVTGNYIGRTVFLTSDSKLYRYNGTAFTAVVPAADITGQLTDAQLAAIAAAKITGQITSTQISDGAISTPKLAAGSVTTNVLAANAVTASTIAAGAITTTKLAAGAVTTSALAAQAVTAATIATNAIVAGKIAAGAIGAAEIAAGAIRANHLLVVGKGPVLNADPMAQDPAAWVTLAGGGFTFVSGITDLTVGSTALSSIAGINVDVGTAELIPVDRDKRYRLELDIKQQNGTTGTAYLGVAWYNALGQLLISNQPQPDGAGTPAGWANGTYSYYGLINGVVPTAWTTYGVSFGNGETFAIPTNARHMRVIALLNYNAAAGSVVRMSNVRLWQRIDADLIVDGSITATKIAAGAIAVGSAAIENGAIRNALIENLAVDSAKIANGAIVTAKISDATITNAKLADAVITSAKIVDASVGTAKITDLAVTTAKIATAAITNAKIGTAAINLANINTASITSLSALTANIGLLRTASSGARMEVASNWLKVYDSSGVRRVQLGDLTA